MSWFWVRGRFGWPFIALAVFNTLLVLIFDYAWRIVNQPFWQLLTALFIVWVLGITVIAVVSRRNSRWRQRA